MKSTTSSSSRYLVGIAIFAMAVILSPMVAGLDPFGSLRVEYQERLEAGSNNSRVDLGLSLPKGSDVYDVAITIQPEDPILAVSDRAFIGKMGSGTMALATFYVAVNESGTPGIYEVPATISYKAEFGPTESVSRTVLLVISERIADPFGSMVAVTDPAVIVPGLGGLEVVLSLPYTGPDDPLYDVSLTLDLDHPFSSANATNHLGVVPSGTLGVATFYLDVAEGAVSGEYDVPVLVRYRLSPDGVFRSASKVAKLFVVSEEVDPFGSLGVVTDPGVLVPGLRGVEVRLSVPYLGGLVDRLYDVSVSLGLVSPFSSEYDTYHLGVVSPQSSLAPSPTAVFYLDVADLGRPGVYEIDVVISYRTSTGGPVLSVSRTIYLRLLEKGGGTFDPFGSMIASTDPGRMLPGAAGVQLKLLLPYIGIEEKAYDVSVYLDLAEPLSSPNEVYYVGMMTTQSPVADIPPAVFYVDVAEGAVSGEYDVPVLVRYRLSPDGVFRSASKVAKLFVVSEEVDPFGSLGVVTDPGVLVPGLRGVEVRLSVPYLGGLVDRLYDVSVSIDLAGMPFTTRSGSQEIGIVSPQSPIGALPEAVFYIDVMESADSLEYDVPVLVRYRLSPDGVFRSASKVAKLFVVSEEVDPFGSLGVVTDPGVLVPGLRGVEVRLSVPYLGGLVDRLYDVSVSLGLVSPFSSEYDTYHLGVMTPQSPVGPTPTSVFHVDIGEGDVCREYEIPVTIRYQLTADGEAREVQRSFKMAVVDPDPVWIVRRLSERLPSGSSSTVSILLENLGGHATDVTAQFVPASPALVKPDEGTVFAGDFGINQSKKLSFPVIVDDDVDGSQQITIRVEYNSGGSRILESHSITLMIGGTEGASLVLKEVAFSPEPMIGSEFEAQLTIHNVGPENAKEALMDLQLPEQITVVGSGSTFNIGEIEAGKSVSISFRLVSDSSATEGTGEVQYLLSWRNPEGEESGRGGSFGLTLTGSPTVVIQRIDIDPPKLEGGTKGTLQVTVRNPGSQLVTDIAIVLKGTPEFFTETLLPIGSLFPKQTDAVVFGLYIDQDTESGTYPVNVSVTYRDASGQEHEEFSDLQLRIHEKKPLLNWVTILIVAAVIAAIVIIYIVFGGSGSRDRPSVDEEES